MRFAPFADRQVPRGASATAERPTPKRPELRIMRTINSRDICRDEDEVTPIFAA